jgi:hypothetical protein
MVKILSLALVIVMLMSCEAHKSTNYDTLKEDLSGAEMVKVRGCEYIRSHVYLGSVYTHCGDCNNPQHKIK